MWQLHRAVAPTWLMIGLYNKIGEVRGTTEDRGTDRSPHLLREPSQLIELEGADGPPA